MEYNLSSEMFQNKNGIRGLEYMQDKANDINTKKIVKEHKNIISIPKINYEAIKIKNFNHDDEMMTRESQNKYEKQNMNHYKPSNEKYNVNRNFNYESSALYNYEDRQYDTINKKNELNFVQQEERSNRKINPIIQTVNKKHDVEYLNERYKPEYKVKTDTSIFYFPSKQY